MGEENEHLSNDSEDFSFWLDKLVCGPSKPHDGKSHIKFAKDLLPSLNSPIPEGSPPDTMLLSPNH